MSIKLSFKHYSEILNSSYINSWILESQYLGDIKRLTIIVEGRTHPLHDDAFTLYHKAIHNYKKYRNKLKEEINTCLRL